MSTELAEKPETKQNVTKTLNPRQRKFVDYYVSEGEFYGNGTRSYVAAYGNKNYQTARSMAKQLMDKPHVIAAINAKLDAAGLNDQNVDKQLLYTIQQHNDLSVKISGIREYNRLKKRINEGNKGVFVGINLTGLFDAAQREGNSQSG